MRLRGELAGVATVDGSEWEPAFGGLGMCSVQPVNPRSVPVHWMELRDEIVLGVSGGGRWELDRTPEVVRLVEAVVRSALAGRVVEIFAPARSWVQVTLDDGRVVDSRVSHGCVTGLIPLPWWTRWGRRVRYEPYA